MNVMLYENWHEEGKTIEGFFDALKSLDECTFVKRVAPENIGLRVLLNSKEDANEMAMLSISNCPGSENKFYSDISKNWERRLTQANLEGRIPMIKFDPEGRSFLTFDKHIDELEGIGISGELLENDLLKKSKLLMTLNYEGEVNAYVVSPLAYSTLLKRASMAGNSFYAPSITRAMNLFRMFQWGMDSTQLFTVITRENRNGAIILAMHAETYLPIPQLTLKTAYNEIKENLGKPQCEKWYVSHEVSVCYINFPEVAKEMAEVYDLPDNVLPGIYIQTSDSGESSFAVGSYWSINGKIISGNVYRKNHRGNIDISSLALKSGQKIFAEFNKVPERLCELLTIDCPSPTETLKSVFKQIGAVEAVGKKRSMQLYDAMCAEFVSGRKYTAYDIAISITTLPDRCSGVSRAFVNNLENLSHKAIFADYRPVKPEEPLILV